MNKIEAKARVARGAAFLDDMRPGWAEEIDLAQLSLAACSRCVLGQLLGSFWNYRDIGLDYTTTFACGFNIDAGDDDILPEFDKLQEAWLEAIAGRTAPAVTWTHRELIGQA